MAAVLSRDPALGDTRARPKREVNGRCKQRQETLSKHLYAAVHIRYGLLRCVGRCVGISYSVALDPSLPQTDPNPAPR